MKDGVEPNQPISGAMIKYLRTSAQYEQLAAELIDAYTTVKDIY